MLRFVAGRSLCASDIYRQSTRRASARPALSALKRSNDVVTDPACVWNLGVGADPDAFVNTVAEVFGELAEEVAVNLRVLETSTGIWTFCAAATGTVTATASRVKLARSERTSEDPA